MALYPNHFSQQDTLQPGARGELFQANLPGYRGEEDRVNRTNSLLNVADHDVPNCKWAFDDRLPILFRYGFAYGFNQIVVPKGRIVALDPSINKVDFDSKKAFNLMTLANGGVPVRLRQIDDVYMEAVDEKGVVSMEKSGAPVVHPGKEWIPLTGLVDNFDENNLFRPFMAEASAKKQLEAAGYTVDEVTGNVLDENGKPVLVRQGNIPIGMLGRNEYTRDEDALNGIMPGPVYTDAMVSLPWFLYKDKAEQTFWGCAYGDLKPGTLLKSDENGRLCVSPLSNSDAVAAMELPEYLAEQRQVIGEVYSTSMDLVPEGAAKWAQWALKDRLNFDETNPDTWRQTNRRGEDNISNSPYASTGMYPGYPFDKAFQEHDLHMLGANLRDGNYNIRLNQEYQYGNGIPGLTDGYNVVKKNIPEERIGQMRARENTENDYVDRIMKVSEVNVEPGTLEIKFGEEEYVNVVAVGQTLDADGIFEISYLSEKQGLIKIHVTDAEKADAYLSALEDKTAVVKAKFTKRGESGVPTQLDWDGCVGEVKVLLTK